MKLKEKGKNKVTERDRKKESGNSRLKERKWTKET